MALARACSASQMVTSPSRTSGSTSFDPKRFALFVARDRHYEGGLGMGRRFKYDHVGIPAQIKHISTNWQGIILLRRVKALNTG